MRTGSPLQMVSQLIAHRWKLVHLFVCLFVLERAKIKMVKLGFFIQFPWFPSAPFVWRGSQWARVYLTSQWMHKHNESFLRANISLIERAKEDSKTSIRPMLVFNLLRALSLSTRHASNVCIIIELKIASAALYTSANPQCAIAIALKAAGTYF